MLDASRIRTCGRWIVTGLFLASLIFAAPAARAGNYLVDPNYAGVSGAPYTNSDGINFAGAYNNIDAALAGTGSVPAGSSASSPNYVYVNKGTYNVGTSQLTCSTKNIDVVGLTGNPDDVVITSTLDSGYTGLSTSSAATMQVTGNNVSFSNLTIANSTDTPYIANVTHQAVTPSGNYASGVTQSSNAPAPALLLNSGDQQLFTNVKILGYQDTLYDKGGRAFFNNSLISGDIDFIFAQGTGVFNNCTINLDSDHPGGTITAASTAKTTSNGLVFLNATITGNSMKGNPVIDPNNGGNANPTAGNSMNLGRPWGWTQGGGDASTVFVNAKVASVGGVPIIKPAGWLAWDSTETNPATTNNGGGNPAQDSRYAEYNTTDLISGNPDDTSSRIGWSHQLTASQAAAFSVTNLFANSYPWYGNGYPSTDTRTLSNTGLPAAGSGSANPSDPNYSWPAFWGDRNINNETSTESPVTLQNDPGSYTNANWKLGGDWDPTMALALAQVEIPEPATAALLGGVILVPLVRRPRRR